MNGQESNIKHASRCYTASEHGSESGKPCHISGRHAEKARFGLEAEKGGKGADTSQIVSDFPGSHALRRGGRGGKMGKGKGEDIDEK